ncbi:pentatricopeptide repeat-containing protein At5g24830-like [Papaver somniferum]|uniref:pentatricopeptide repeat-containing protein At5g24830-like n=1 Tax=Papaver somniferum TaxID=3469 RepID=UPI000E6F958A|nr:pentatricopeptide repeat-containing protein At5g24830-like [Papaver somniferum]
MWHLAWLRGQFALDVSDAALDIVLTENYDLVYGARLIRRWLENKVVTELSKMLIREEIDEKSTVYIDASLDGAELTYRVEKNGRLVNAITEIALDTTASGLNIIHLVIMLMFLPLLVSLELELTLNTQIYCQRFYMNMVRIQPDLFTLCILINCYCKLGDVDCGFYVFGEMIKRGYEPDTVVYTTLIKGLCMQGLVRNAIKVFEKMADGGVRPNVVSCGTVIYGLCRIGEVDLALELHRNMVKWKCSPNLITYNSLIHGFCNVERVSSVVKEELSMNDFQSKDILPASDDLITEISNGVNGKHQTDS